MDKIISPHSPEAAAHNHLQENWFSWDLDNINESLVSNCASYSAFDRYISGADLYIVPRTQADLENILKRYSYDAIHNAIAKSRSTLQPGGYSRVCVLAEKSIRGILNSGDNVNFLLGLHRRAENKTSPNGNGCPVPVISTEW
ncbi:hypothetical protein AGABI1DRAFT_113474 [Agaricus bisporus var. burnettii JB137-S8]|uniref:Uncharacterized protein n=1 Tax=Agaricus bisporus var. burnettii (strain JB137-S8 / ATCC MYA-4627 / FGSC 10392) TaxID=597362 RepID=K5W0F5_AGABU|nr:uncharacterized protein AGABI1DRAFT_113474 [Agaricus bisporus var. burnettii JB137-S8]EKM80274.1 hypothetical protein AGABI1DRAFT_113474 [Agaricus bisporus var. burnettii JB137-S8]